MNKRYSVLQGNMTEFGKGDLFEMMSYDTLEEAQKYMNDIYNDVNGYTKYSYGYLETFIVDNYKEVDDPFYFVDVIIYNY